MTSLDEISSGLPPEPASDAKWGDAAPREVNEARAKADLACISPDIDRIEWFKIIVALRATDIIGGDARHLASAWSRGDIGARPCPASYRVGAEAEIDKIFATTSPVRGDGPSIGYHTIERLSDDAREAAGEPPLYRQPNPSLDKRAAEEVFPHLAAPGCIAAKALYERFGALPGGHWIYRERRNRTRCAQREDRRAAQRRQRQDNLV